MAALAVAYAAVVPHLEKAVAIVRSLAMGLVFGAAGAVAMYLPVDFAPGIIFDVRAVPILLSGAFGGPLAAVVAGLSIGGIRIAIGGAGTVPALLAIVGFVCLSIGLWHLRQRNPRFGVQHLAIAGLLSILPIALGISLLGIELAQTILSELAVPIMVTHTGGCYLVGWLLLSEDRRRRTEKQLKIARIAADDANEAKSQFLAHVSHELRTPMSAIIGSLELLSMERLRAEHHEMLEVTRRSAKNLVELLNDLLDLSKIEAGRMVFTEHPLNVHELLNDLQTLYKKTITSKSLDLKLEVGKDLPEYIEIDGHRLEQILNNLLGNALKFTAEGHVEIAANVGPPNDEHSMIQIVVRDTGVGIPVSRQEAVFDVFEQADAQVDQKFGGTGLGLAISRKLARAMGGDLTLQSVEKVGTSMTLQLPFRRVDMRYQEFDTARIEPSLTDLVSAKPFANRRILLAEDVEASRMVISRMLTALGAEVVAVTDGAEAVSEAAKGVDVILMDMQMPVVDGPEATRQIRRLDGQAAETPIFALTADAAQENKRLYHTAGLDGVLTKPVDWSELVAVIGGFGGSADSRSRNRESTFPSPPDSSSMATLHDLKTAQFPHWNRETIDSLELALGRQTVSDLLNRLPISIGLCVDDVKAALSEKADFQDRIQLSAHALKGAAANLGFDRLHAMAERLEASREYGDAQSATAALEEELREIEVLIQGYTSAWQRTERQSDKSLSGSM
ncbi:ATP-binding protein [Algihabitans albus]|uniref:ATP-binding protein n=1 Tax=Algihabitans albus TaxID=2164067 RepID=UPI0013C3617D|nr:ATP-binding protein [Algihabitans albus]